MYTWKFEQAGILLDSSLANLSKCRIYNTYICKRKIMFDRERGNEENPVAFIKRIHYDYSE